MAIERITGNIGIFTSVSSTNQANQKKVVYQLIEVGNRRLQNIVIPGNLDLFFAQGNEVDFLLDGNSVVAVLSKERNLLFHKKYVISGTSGLIIGIAIGIPSIMFMGIGLVIIPATLISYFGFKRFEEAASKYYSGYSREAI